MTQKYRKSRELCSTKYCRGVRAKCRKVCHKCHQRKWRLNHPERSAYAAIRDHAKARKIKFLLTFDEFIDVVSGTEYIDKKGTKKHCLQIDRIKADMPYSRDNVCVITCSENSIKGNHEKLNPAYSAHYASRKAVEPED